MFCSSQISNCGRTFLRISTQKSKPNDYRHFSLLLTNSYADREFLVDKTHFNPIPVHNRRNLIAFVTDRKDGYRSLKPVSNRQHVIDGFQILKDEIKLWKSEFKDRILIDPDLVSPPREIDPLFEFGKGDDIKKFIATSDSDHNEGYSHCSFEQSPAGYGLFSGRVDSTVPKQGKLAEAGYCNITSLRVKKSFQRNSYYDWSMYNTLVLRVRGDGRSYSLILRTDSFYDFTWHDAYYYVLYTRGGPHWQLTKIPFSKFVFGASGAIQDRQCALPTNLISRLGITVASRNFADGDFRLEIDYIGLENNPHHTEENAYEWYNVPNGVVGT